MEILKEFETQLTPVERKLLDDLNSPIEIQTFLNTIPYSADEFYRCPLRVLRERAAHCFDGALFAAMALLLRMELYFRESERSLKVWSSSGHSRKRLFPQRKTYRCLASALECKCSWR